MSDMIMTAHNCLSLLIMSVTESLKSKYSSSTRDKRICQFEMVLNLVLDIKIKYKSRQ